MRVRIGISTLLLILGASTAYGAEDCGTCLAGSVGNPIAAAFASEGYYVMSDAVWQLAYTDFGLWAPLIYILSAFGGLMMMAMGQPPRNYLWFFLGPAIYKWLLFTFEPSRGVGWRVAGVEQEQALVWKLAETGLKNTNFAERYGMKVDKVSGPNQAAPVPMVFLWADELISAQVQQLMNWTGIYRQKPASGEKTNTHKLGSSGDAINQAWHILINNKWPMLENITAATIHDAEMREAFMVFMSSECGDVVSRFTDQQAYATAANSKGLSIQDLNVYPVKGPTLNRFQEELREVIVPVPRSVRAIQKGAVVGSSGTESGGQAARWFGDFESRIKPREGKEWRNLSCYHYFHLIVQMFRYQTGLAYNQFVREAADHGIGEDNIVYDFLYGWDITEQNGLTPEQQKHFIQDLILVHMFRNEIAMAPSHADLRYTPAERTINYTEAYQRNVGSKSKYGELYTWVRMMPYVQGVLLYIITLAYPFVCIVMIIPGWHKIMFTWLGFFAWAKSWDFGFAVCMALERSVWASVGNSLDQRAVNERIFEMQEGIGASITVECKTGGASGSPPISLPLGCPDPKITDNIKGSEQTIFELYDSMMVLTGQLDMDLKNSFYIYIMSALYFGVPAVTGQIFLGAKAGASGMVNTMVGGVSSEAGRGAASGFQGEVATRGHNSQAIVGQEAFKKALSKGDGASLLGKSYSATYGQHAHEMDSARAQHQASQQEGIEKVGSAYTGHANERHQIAQGFLKGGRDLTQSLKSSPREASKTGKRGGAGKKGAGKSQEVSALSKDGLASMLDKAGDGIALAGNLGLQMGNYQRNAAQHALTAGSMQARARYGKEAFVASQRGRGEGVMAGRYQQAAQQQAAEAQWAAMRDWSRQVTGQASALGVFAGAFHAQQKPAQIDGMAGLGMLGRGEKGKGSYRDNAKAGFSMMTDQWQAKIKKAQVGMIDGDSGSLKFQRIQPGHFEGSVVGDFAEHAPTMGFKTLENESKGLIKGAAKAADWNNKD